MSEMGMAMMGSGLASGEDRLKMLKLLFPVH